MSKKNNYEISNDTLREILDNIKDCEYLEYIYLNNNRYAKKSLNELDDDMMIITQKDNHLYMIDSDKYQDAFRAEDMLEFTPKVDLMILDKDNSLPYSKMKQMMTDDTIISKIYDNGIIYIEDNRENQQILLTHEYIYLIKGRGINTDIRVTKPE